MPAIDAVLMMLPPRPCAFMRAAPCLMPRNTPRTSTAKVKSHSSTVVSPMGPKAPPTPALLNTQSSPPKRSTARATSAATSRSAETSARSGARRSAVPRARASATVSARLASLTSPMATRAPSRRKVSAPARPLAARLHPGLRPRQGGAAPLPVAAHLRPHLAGRHLAVDLELGRAGREEGAEDADRPVVEAGRGVEHEGFDAVVPGHGDARVGGGHGLGGGRPGAAVPIEARRDHRHRGVGEGGEEQLLDGGLQPPRHRDVVAVDLH